MTRGLAAALAIEMVLLGAILLLGLDMFAHRQVEQLGGVNVRGYRGPVMRQKQQNEIRVAVVGGDLAFGWGVAASETLAPSIRQMVALDVDMPGRPLTPVTSVGLGAMGLAPAEYATWIARFRDVGSDVLCLLPDPPTYAPSPSGWLPDRRSLAFVWFGYSPILPLVVREKAAVAGSGLLQQVAVVLEQIDGALSKPDAGEGRAGWVESIDLAVRAGLDVAGAGVVVVLPPRASEGTDGAGVFKALIGERFKDNVRVRVIDLGEDARLNGADLRLDGFSFSAGGHARAAQHVAPAVMSLLQSQGRLR